MEPIVETITARFELTLAAPFDLPGVEGGWVQGLSMHKTFTAGLVGQSDLVFLTSGEEETGRGYVAVERIVGTLDDGRRGAITVHHGAMQTPSDSGQFGNIVPGSGAGDFVHFTGSAAIQHDNEGPFFVLSLMTH
ncbi:hypothetical protein AX769_11780 [Frondihabitans sp. PAMC 28766]|uniref:DUF3224 domain-containing protein n=1 Tax=Frondihabitans sp. PAMC 28766 TaxID=1795630 RepID=UPI00078B7132|nr:DUF3224 domain-containing protein [Frondihabitans sp. PAMC 28766]AMM20695.1 hypothetical protein AX769_11780 [Frondihabitans sp. PAMC 28766]